MLLLIAILVIVLGIAVLGLGRRLQAEAGLPGGRVIYDDAGRWRPSNRPLYSPLYHLAGKPDYLVKRSRQTIPVEVKSSNAPADGPRRSHLLQLAAYCALVEETTGRRPAVGIIKYADRMFEIDYTPALETALSDTLNAMRGDLARGLATRSHHEPGRCAHCAYRHACDERLA